MSVQDILTLLDAHLRLHERLAQTERTQTERAFEAACANAFFDLRFDIEQAMSAAGAEAAR